MFSVYLYNSALDLGQSVQPRCLSVCAYLHRVTQDTIQFSDVFNIVTKQSQVFCSLSEIAVHFMCPNYYNTICIC